MEMFAYNLKRIRKIQNETQSSLGKKLGVSDKTVGSWETGRTEPNMEMIEKISKALCCNKSDLMGWSTDVPEYIPGTAEVADLYCRITEEQREIVLNLLRSMVSS